MKRPGAAAALVITCVVVLIFALSGRAQAVVVTDAVEGFCEMETKFLNDKLHAVVDYQKKPDGSRRTDGAGWEGFDSNGLETLDKVVGSIQVRKGGKWRTIVGPKTWKGQAVAEWPQADTKWTTRALRGVFDAHSDGKKCRVTVRVP